MGKLIGIAGVFIGTIASTLAAPFWVEPYVLYKHYFKKSVWHYWKRYAIYTLVTVVIGAITWAVCTILPTGGLWLLIARFAICAVVPTTLYVLAYHRTDEFKFFKDLLLSFVKKKKAVETAEQESVSTQTIIEISEENEINDNKEA